MKKLIAVLAGLGIALSAVSLAAESDPKTHKEKKGHKAKNSTKPKTTGHEKLME